MKRYIAVFLCLITLIPLLALPASAAVIVGNIQNLYLEDYLVSREPISGTGLMRSVYKLHSNKAVVQENNNYSVKSGNLFTLSNITSSSYLQNGYYIPFCDPINGVDTALDRIAGYELFDATFIQPGSVVSLEVPFNFHFTCSTSSLINFYIRPYFLNSNGRSVSFSNYNVYNSVDDVLYEGNAQPAYSITGNNFTNYSGSLTVSFVMPENIAYFCPVFYVNIPLGYAGFDSFLRVDELIMTVESVPDAESPVFLCNWDNNTPINYTRFETASPLIVDVDELSYGVYSYQWYSGNRLGFDYAHPYGYGTPIDGATFSSYTPRTNSPGTYTYYCIVKHTSGVSVVYDATPNATIVVKNPDPESPSVTNPNQPSYEYTWTSDPIELVYIPTVSDGGTLSYQWFVGTEPYVGDPISGATSSAFLPFTDKTGTYYYWCEITNDNGYSSVTVKSETTKVTVTKPTIDDVTYNWSNSPMELEKGSIHTFHLNVPSGLYDPGTVSYQWYRVHDVFYTEAIPGETSSGFKVPTDEAGVYRYACVLTGKDGNTTVRTMFQTGSVIVVDEFTTWPGFDDFTGISWNWSDDPIRLEQNSFHLLQVNVPASYGDVTVQWYSKVEGENYVSIPGESDLIFDVPTDELGAVSYTCAIVFNDGTGFSRTAKVIVVESDNYNAGTAGSGSTDIDHTDYFKPTQKNNLDLAEWAIDAYESGWGYVMGTYGQILTQDLFDYKLNQYPDAVSPYFGFIQSHWLNKRTADCVGLIKGYCWYDPATGSIEYATNDTPDYSADQMYDWCVEKGPMSTMPEIPGLLLWKQGHVGIYIGNGYVIEARGTTHGVIKSKIDNLAWTNWAKIPSINYINSQITDDPEDDEDDDDAALGGIWQSIKNLPNAILDGIKGLFVPDAEEISAYQDQWQELMSARFGAIYQSVSIIDEFARSISEADQQNTIHFPAVSMDLAGEPFEFGGWDVQIVPEGFDFLIDTLKRIISIIATLGFVNAMRNKFEKILGG